MNVGRFVPSTNMYLWRGTYSDRKGRSFAGWRRSWRQARRLTKCEVAVPSTCLRSFLKQLMPLKSTYSITVTPCNTMDVILHIVSYATPTALLTVGLAPSLLPMAFKPLPVVLSGLFSALVSHFYPAPRSDNLFTLFHWIMWSLSCIWLIVLREWCGILLNINLTGYRLAFTDFFILFGNPSWTVILLTLPTITFLGAVFRRIIGHDDDDLGIFGKLVHTFGCGIKCVWLGCCEFAKKVHEGMIAGLSQCSSDVKDGVSTTDSPPCYTASLHYTSKQLLLISYFARSHALTKHLHTTTGNLILWFDLCVIPLLLYNDFESICLSST